MPDAVEVIVSDSGDAASEAAADFAEGLVVGVAAETAAAAAETADAAEAEAGLAVAAVVSVEDQLAELRAVLIGLHDEMLANDATLAEHLAVLLEAEEDTMEEAEAALGEAATAEAEVTEIVEEHAEEHSADEQSSEPAESPEAPPEASDGGESGRHERAGSIRFRRGRRR